MYCTTQCNASWDINRNRGGSIDFNVYLQAGDLHFSSGEGGLQMGQVDIFLGQGGVPLRYSRLERQIRSHADTALSLTGEEWQCVAMEAD